MLSEDRLQIEETVDNESERLLLHAECDRNEETFHSFLDEDAYAKLLAEGDRKLSHQALAGVILIFLYR